MQPNGWIHSRCTRVKRSNRVENTFWYQHSIRWFLPSHLICAPQHLLLVNCYTVIFLSWTWLTLSSTILKVTHLPPTNVLALMPCRHRCCWFTSQFWLTYIYCMVNMIVSSIVRRVVTLFTVNRYHPDTWIANGAAPILARALGLSSSRSRGMCNHFELIVKKTIWGRWHMPWVKYGLIASDDQISGMRNLSFELARELCTSWEKEGNVTFMIITAGMRITIMPISIYLLPSTRCPIPMMTNLQPRVVNEPGKW